MSDFPNILVQENTGSSFSIMLDEELGEPKTLRNLFQVFLTATSEDTINLFINGPGGYLDSCIQLVGMIRSTEAHVVAHLMGEAASAHSFIFLAADEWVVHPSTKLLLHSYSGGNFGKGQDNVKAAQATYKQFEELCHNVYSPFLDDGEIQDILNNSDRYVHSEEIIERLGLVALHREEESEKATQEYKEQTIKMLQES